MNFSGYHHWEKHFQWFQKKKFQVAKKVGIIDEKNIDKHMRSLRSDYRQPSKHLSSLKKKEMRWSWKFSTISDRDESAVYKRWNVKWSLFLEDTAIITSSVERYQMKRYEKDE